MTEIETVSREKQLDFDSLQRPGYNEIASIVEDSGPCQYISSIRINPDPPQEELLRYDSDKGVSPIVLEAAVDKIRALRPWLVTALESDRFVDSLDSIPDGGTLRPEQIKQTLGISDIPTIERLYNILNFDIDPALIPLSLEQLREYFPAVPTDLLKLLETNDYLKMRLTSILTQEGNINQFQSVHPTRPYSEDLVHQINGFINNCIYARSTLPGATTAEMAALKDYLEVFFNASQEPFVSPPAIGLYFNLTGKTISSYFQYKQKQEKYDPYLENSDEAKWFPLSAFSDPTYLLNLIKRRHEAVGAAEYMFLLYQHIQDIYQKFFPEVYIDPAIESLKITDPRDKYKDPEEEYIDEAGGSYDNLTKRITIKSGTTVKASGKDGFDETTLSFLGPRMKRKVNDVIVMSHEMAHAIYEQRVRKRGGSRINSNYGNTADHAINEGFAVTMELLFADLLKANPQLLNLDDQDITDLEGWKTKRLYRLKAHRNGYTEGAFWIIHSVFAEAAGKRNQRDVSAGLDAVREFLEGLDPNRTLEISRDNPEYLELLKKKNPVLWATFFATPVASLVAS